MQSDVDYVIDALGEKEFSRELSVLKKRRYPAQPAHRAEQGICREKQVFLC